MNIKEIINRMIDILKDKHTTWFYLELSKIDAEALRQKIISILNDKRGGWDIPDEEIEAIADVLLPSIIKFFSSDEWRAEFEAWKKEQELLVKKKENKNGVA